MNIKWFYDGTLNASANCIDRHLKNNKDKTAIMWVGDDPKVQKKITYKQLHNEVCKIANGLKEIDLIFKVSAQLITNKASMKIKTLRRIHKPLIFFRVIIQNHL